MRKEQKLNEIKAALAARIVDLVEQVITHSSIGNERRLEEQCEKTVYPFSCYPASKFSFRWQLDDAKERKEGLPCNP